MHSFVLAYQINYFNFYFFCGQKCWLLTNVLFDRNSNSQSGLLSFNCTLVLVKICPSFFPFYGTHLLGCTVFVNWIYVHIWYLLFLVAGQIGVFSAFYWWNFYHEGTEWWVSTEGYESSVGFVSKMRRVC